MTPAAPPAAVVCLNTGRAGSEEKKDEALVAGLDFSGSASSRVGPGVDGIAGAERKRDRRSAGSDTGHGLPLLQQRHEQFCVSNAERIRHGEQLCFGLRGGVLRRKRDGGELLGCLHGTGLFFDGVGAGAGDGSADCERDRVHGGCECDQCEQCDEFHGQLGRGRDGDAERDDRGQGQRRRGTGERECVEQQCFVAVDGSDEHHNDHFIDPGRQREPLQQRVGGDECCGIQAGTSAAQTEELQWQNYSGTAEWDNTVDTSYTYHIQDAAHSSLDRITIYQGGGNTNINAGNGAYAVCLNCAANSGTAGLVLQNGASISIDGADRDGKRQYDGDGICVGQVFHWQRRDVAGGRCGGGIEPVDCLRDEPRVRRRERYGDIDDRNQPDNGDAGNDFVPQHSYQLRQLHGDDRGASAVIMSNTWAESTTAITITANTALTASTAYSLKYWCGGN